MCYTLPGPRCSAHLLVLINKLEKAIAEEIDASKYSMQEFLRNPNPTGDALQGKLKKARFDYAGTRVGQKELEARIQQEKSVTKQRSLMELKIMARASYDKDKAEYVQLQEWIAQEVAQEKIRKKEAAVVLAAAKRKAAAEKILEDDMQIGIRNSLKKKT